MIINVLIADNQLLTSEGITALLTTVKDIEVAGKASTDDELEGLVNELKPEVIIIDHDYNNHFDIQKLILKFPETGILILSNRQQRDEIIAFKNLGIINYLFKECTRDELIKAVYATVKGEQFYCKTTLKTLYGENTPLAKPEGLALLTPREIEIVHLVADGLTNKEIADKLFLSYHTIKTHRKNIIKKLGFSFKNAAELVSLISNP
jgi:DNA-binding NarL/FixJ family response regulator